MDREQLLVIDDDQGLLKLLTMRLTAMGFAVTACYDANTALDEARRQRFDLVLTDLRLAEADGLAVMDEVRVLHPNLTVISKDRYWPEAMEQRTRPLTQPQRTPSQQ